MAYFFLLFALLTNNLYAGFSLRTNLDSNRTQNFLKEVERVLPSKMKEVINREVLIEFTELDNYDSLQNPCVKKEEKQVYGKLGSSILINKNLIPYIENKKSLTFSCGHKDAYRLAVATIIHELVHLFERKSTDEYSQSKTYLALVQGQETVLGPDKIKNQSTGRSPDPYELANTREHFAVNAEYFFLDSEYACRRPNLNRFFEEVFAKRNSRCNPNPEIRILDGDQSLQMNLSPDRIKEVQFLIAGKGEAMMSRFGHVMFRLVTNNEDQDVVLSFVAQVDSTIISMIKGLTGKYPSKMFIYPYKTALQRYSRSELREVTSYPLKLSENEKTIFLQQVISLYWEYSGKFYFLSNNCATEGLTLLKSSIRKKSFQEQSVTTPNDLKDLLIKENLVDLSRVKILPSPWKKLEKIYESIKGDTGIETLDEYWKLSALKRRELFPSINSSSIYPFLAIENAKIFLVNRELEIALGVRLKPLDKDDPIKLLSDQIVRLSNELTYGQSLHRGYGIPMQQDFDYVGEREIQNKQQTLAGLNNQLASWIKEGHFEALEEYNGIIENEAMLKGLLMQ
ncbi:MAG: DUF4105 domain-containing protein [Bacteriovoracaceae bacterium]